ncbi:hypothetical protein HPB52_013614 [Rhipicephalus sanguineus]|uniref:High-affinity choline transporter 1 n=1 Tax=Rhipicephalus sanguineus TaxID=34632 RepID=A0A9D4T079_RHISA|nr:hypothetical protein HPB52_013614 [Rhipicephalus sanguineus]
MSLLSTMAIVLYFVAVVVVGVWSSRKVLHIESPPEGSSRSSRRHSSMPFSRMYNTNEYLLRLLLANRSVPLKLSFLSMTATWVGGGYISGTAEAVFNYGIAWCHAPLGYALSLLMGGWLFAGKMRATRAITMIDPFQLHYGRWIALPLCVPAICGEVFWTAAILAALGDMMAAVTQMDTPFFIMLSSGVILFYTTLGGLYSVIYTDAFQLASTIVGLVYFQRVLCTGSVFNAKMFSYMAAASCVFLALPSIIIGAVAKSTNFTAAGYRGPFNLAEGERHKVLLYALRYMTPGSVALLGHIAITAAVMSSVDSSMLSASSLFTRNIYHFILRPAASNMEVCVVLRCMVTLIGAVATLFALQVSSVFALWTLSSDLVYVLLFPQFVALFYMPGVTNAYGSVLGFCMGLALRFLCGEQVVGLPALLHLPLYDRERGQQFPYRTLCMIVSLSGQLVGSEAAAACYRSGRFHDYWRCFAEATLHQGPEGTAADVPVCTAPRVTSASHSEEHHHNGHHHHHHHHHHERNSVPYTALIPLLPSTSDHGQFKEAKTAIAMDKLSHTNAGASVAAAGFGGSTGTGGSAVICGSARIGGATTSGATTSASVKDQASRRRSAARPAESSSSDTKKNKHLLRKGSVGESLSISQFKKRHK